MKDTQNHCAGQQRALAIQGLRRRIMVRLCCLGVFVMCGITFGSVRVIADDDDIVVPRDFPTIQAAVDAAPPGASIKVSRGTYTEEIVITKDLHVEGAGVGDTILQSPATLTPFAVWVPTETPLGTVVRITNGAKVRMFGFTVTGPVPCAVYAQGIIVVEGARLTLAESHVTRMRPEPEPSTCNPGSGIRIGFPALFRVGSQLGSTGHGEITDVIIDRYRGDGIGVGGPAGGAASTATISHTVILEGTGLVNSSQGIAIRQNAVARVTENIVAGNVCTESFCGPDPLNDAQSAGIIAFDARPSSIEILDNHIFANDIGIYQVASPHCCTISANRISHNRFFGIAIQDGDGTTLENTITGGRVGIAVVAGTADTVGVLQGDRIRRASMAPVQELECCGFKATAKGYGGKAELLVRVLIQKNHPVLFGTKTEVFECHAFFASLPNRQLEVMADRPDRVRVDDISVPQRHRKEAHGELTYLVEAAGDGDCDPPRSACWVRPVWSEGVGLSG